MSTETGHESSFCNPISLSDINSACLNDKEQHYETDVIHTYNFIIVSGHYELLWVILRGKWSLFNENKQNTYLFHIYSSMTSNII